MFSTCDFAIGLPYTHATAFQAAAVECLLGSGRFDQSRRPVNGPLGIHLVRSTLLRGTEAWFGRREEVLGLLSERNYKVPNRIRVAQKLLAARVVHPAKVYPEKGRARPLNDAHRPEQMPPQSRSFGPDPW